VLVLRDGRWVGRWNVRTKPSRAKPYATSISAPFGDPPSPLRSDSGHPSPEVELAWLAIRSSPMFTERRMVGLSRFELLTPRLSSVCSNQLSYRPRYSLQRTRLPVLSKLDKRARHSPENQIDLRMIPEGTHSRKEVIQPQVLLQLPCYDFTPITDHTLGASLPCGLVWRLLVQPAFVM
jgi:hypothetical protein